MNNYGSPRTIAHALLLFALISMTSLDTPFSDDAASSCFTKCGEKEQCLVLDANTGQIISGATYYPRNTGVKVVVTNKNPFKYIYAYGSEVKAIDQSDDISALLKLFAPLGAVPDIVGVSKDADTKAGMSALGFMGGAATRSGEQACTGDDKAFLTAIMTNLATVSSQGEPLAAAAQNAKTTFDPLQKDYEEFVKLADLDQLDCQTAEKSARTTEPRLRTFSLGSLPTDASKYSENVSALEKMIDGFHSANPTCQKARDLLLDYTRDLQDKSKSLSTAVTKMVEGKKSFDVTAEVIRSALASDPFFEVHPIAPQRRPSTAKLTVTRTLRSKPDQKTTNTVDLELGEPFFSLAVGIGASSIAEQEFGQVDSLVPDGAGGTVLGKRFAVTNDSHPTPLGAVLLHANLWEWDGAVGALSMGVSIGDNDNASAFGYLFGFSTGFLDRRFYVTFAYHLRSVDALGGGFSEDDVVPTGLTTVPVQRTTDDGVMFAFTVRVK